MSDTALLRIDRVSKIFDLSPSLIIRALTGTDRTLLPAVDAVSFDIAEGTTFGLVGESGCGKSTLARIAVGLVEPSEGQVLFNGEPVSAPGGGGAIGRGRLQMVFQDPFASVNPRWTVSDIVGEPMAVAGVPRAEREERVRALLTQVGLAAADTEKFPHAFSGGQRQRISIARALASRPDFLVCDEPTSALDVSVQAQILNLMKALQRDLGLTYLFISHDLAVISHMADRVGVMYLGRIVEIADADALFSAPRHPYTRMLMEAIPSLEAAHTREDAVRGDVANALDRPSGCHFHPRCPFANERCRTEDPQMTHHGHTAVACHGVEEGRLPAWTSTRE